MVHTLAASRDVYSLSIVATSSCPALYTHIVCHSQVHTVCVKMLSAVRSEKFNNIIINIYIAVITTRSMCKVYTDPCDVLK